MADIDVELLPGRTVSLGVDTPSITLDVHAVITSGGGGGGASALADLTDVDLTPPPYNNQVLTYDGTTATWVPAPTRIVFVDYLMPTSVDTFVENGARPGDLLPLYGIDATFWFQGEATYPADNGIWVCTSGGTATQLSPQPGGKGTFVYTYNEYVPASAGGPSFTGSYQAWINFLGGDASTAAGWSPLVLDAEAITYTPGVAADWQGANPSDVMGALDNLAATDGLVAHDSGTGNFVGDKRGTVYVTGTSSITVTLPLAADGTGRTVTIVKASATGTVTVAAQTGDAIVAGTTTLTGTAYQTRQYRAVTSTDWIEI